MTRWPARERALAGLAALVLVGGIIVSSETRGAAAAPQIRRAIPSSPVGSLYATDYFTASLLAYTPGSSDDATPDRAVTGGDTGMTTVTDVAVDSSGEAYVTDNGQSVLEYFADARGDVAPNASISGASTELDFPSAIALAPNGNLWVANFDGGSLLEFAAGASGDAAPIDVISGSKTGLGDVAGIAVSPDGAHVWASNQVPSAGSLTEYSTAQHGNVAPLDTIAGASTGLAKNTPWDLAVDTDGAVWVSLGSTVEPAVLEFAAGASGNTQPEIAIAGGGTGLSEPTGIALDPYGDVFVADEGHHDIAEWKASNQFTGAVPDVTISGADTGLNQQDSPDGVGVYWQPLDPPNGLVATAAKTGIALRWLAPGGPPARTEVTSYIVKRSASASGPFRPIATVSHRSYLDDHVSPGKTYYYRILAANHVSTSLAIDNEDDRSATFIAAPSAPVAVKARATLRSVVVSWHPPAHLNGSTLTGYTIRYATCKVGRSHCKARTRRVSRTARRVRIHGLRRRTRYFFVVQARSSAGAGRPSKRTTFITGP